MNDLMIKSPVEKGFTLIEMMVTMAIALVVLGGLMLSFSHQNSEYKYQGKRIDAVQDLEFVMKFISEDLRSSLASAGTPVSIASNATNPFSTSAIDFYVWDDVSAPGADQRAHRQYTYNPATNILKYDREITDATAPAEVLQRVTFFKVFEDGVTSRNVPAGHGNAGSPYQGIPSAQPQINLTDPAVSNVSGYTVLIEVEVDAGYKNGSFLDILGDDQSPGVGDGRKRIWRYIQIYPRTSVN